jgi:5-methylcytosine-specific restriction endonuclease McrA
MVCAGRNTENKEVKEMPRRNKRSKLNRRHYFLNPRRSEEYRNWRRAVLKRDNYTCQICGRKSKKKRIKLTAHHIKSFSEFPSLRYIVKNGITLCEKCHRQLHKDILDQLNKK